MVTGCQDTPGCVAYIGISYEPKTQAGHLGIAAIGNASGNYELPAPASIKAEAGAYTSKIPADEAISMIDGSASVGTRSSTTSMPSCRARNAARRWPRRSSPS